MSRIAHKLLEPQSCLNPNSRGGPRSLSAGAKEQGYLIEQVIKQSVVIPYLPALQRMIGDVYAVIFLQQASYRFRCNQYRPFYKFILPCTSGLYRPGDSWLEELAFTRRKLQRAINRVSTRLSGTRKCQRQDRDEVLSHTLAELDETGRMVNSKALVLYWSTRDHMTWWMVNIPLLLHTLQLSQTATIRLVKQPLIETSTGLMHKTCVEIPHAEITNREDHSDSFDSSLAPKNEIEFDGVQSILPMAEINEYVDILAQLCRINLSMCSPHLRDEITEAAKHLHNTRRTFEQIALISHWWERHFWKGQRGTSPRPQELLDHYGSVESFYRGGEYSDCCEIFMMEWRASNGLEAKRL